MTTKVALWAIISIFLALIGYVFLVGLPRQTTTYVLEKTWFDRDYVYIKHRKNITTSRSSLINIHGHIVKEDSTWYLTKLSKQSLGNSGSVLLQEDKRADTIIYEDPDVSVRKENSGTFLTGSGFSKAIPTCDTRVWEYEDVIRHGDKLFYCGTLMSVSDGRLWQMSDELLKRIDAAIPLPIPEDPVYAGRKRKLVATFADDQLLVTFSGKRIDLPLPVIDIFAIDLSGMDIIDKVNIPVPFKSERYFVRNGDGDKVFAPYNVFAVQDGSIGDVQFFSCNKSGCRDLARVSIGRRLLVDEINRTLYLISQERFVDREVYIQVIKY